MTKGKQDDARRKQVINLRKAGKTQFEIADILGTTRDAVAYYLRGSKLPKQIRRDPAPVKHGKRRCAECKELKSIGAFPSERNAVCRRCYRQRKA